MALKRYARTYLLVNRNGKLQPVSMVTIVGTPSRGPSHSCHPRRGVVEPDSCHPQLIHRPERVLWITYLDVETLSTLSP